MHSDAPDTSETALLLGGDVMTGRGIDQVLPHAGNPRLRERSVESAETYVELAERENGPVPAPVDPTYIWGERLAFLEGDDTTASIVNLETAVTESDEFWPNKVVHYRMHPDNVPCLEAAGLDVCTLANNHAMDFDRSGLLETLEVLGDTDIELTGAGRDGDEASQPARVELTDGCGLLVFAYGSTTSGIPRDWKAEKNRPGIRLLEDLSSAVAEDVAADIRGAKDPGDIAVASIHWGSNWGFEVPSNQVTFAHTLVENGVDVVHGHSSHHLRPVEVHDGKLILYGCGDLVTDYEGIGGHERWRGELGALYLATLSTDDGTLEDLRLVPTEMQRLQLTRPAVDDVEWMTTTLNRISRPFGTSFRQVSEDSILWNGAPSR